MKKLILVSGPMGAGKTAVCQALKHRLPAAVFLDGDWCWDASPFVVTDETKAMVMDNIGHLLRGFLRCGAYEHVIFCWVMHQDAIARDVLAQVQGLPFEAHRIVLTLTPEALAQRVGADIRAGLREEAALARSLSYLPLYEGMPGTHVDVSEISAGDAAEAIAGMLDCKGN